MSSILINPPPIRRNRPEPPSTRDDLQGQRPLYGSGDSGQPISQQLFLPKVAAYSAGFIIPKKPAEELGEGFRKNPVGTGPFIFKQYLPKEKLVAVRTPNSTGALPSWPASSFSICRT